MRLMRGRRIDEMALRDLFADDEGATGRGSKSAVSAAKSGAKNLMVPLRHQRKVELVFIAWLLLRVKGGRKNA
jgi:hypothetical protein